MTAITAPTPPVQELAALTRDLLARHPQDVWRTLREAGVLTASLPVELGGEGYGLAGHAAVLTQLGRAVALTPYRDAAVAAEVVAAFATPEQRLAWLEPFLAGGAPLGTAVVDGVIDEGPTRAEATADGWRLTGVKTLVHDGGPGGVLLVAAAGPEGELVLGVPADAPGVRRTAQRLTDGIAGPNAVEVAFEGVEVSQGAVLGGPEVLARIRSAQVLLACAEQAGVLAAALEETAAYVREREQFGRPLGSFQAVSQRLADAYVDVRAAELTLAEALRSGAPAALATAAYWAAEAGHRVAHTCVHLHGGTGLDLDAPAHLHFAAAKRIEFDLGGATRSLLDLANRLAPD